jgi:hypothetical protein
MITSTPAQQEASDKFGSRPHARKRTCREPLQEDNTRIIRRSDPKIDLLPRPSRVMDYTKNGGNRSNLGPGPSIAEVNPDRDDEEVSVSAVTAAY